MGDGFFIGVVMPTKAEMVMQALNGLLSGLAGVTVAREGDVPLKMAAGSRFVLLPDGETDEEEENGGEAWITHEIELSLAVSAVVAAARGEAFDDLRRDVKAVLLVDKTLGGLVETMSISGVFDVETDEPDGAHPIKGAKMRLTLEYME